MIRKIFALVLAVGLMAGFASAGSALFTSTASVAANSFTAGTVIISASPSSALVTFSNMAPGDQVTDPLTVNNAGTLALRYAMTTSATNADSKNLMSQLVLTIKSGVTTCTNAGFGASGTQVYSGSLSGGTIGDPTTGAQSGDRVLNAGANETLCFNVALPGSSGNTYQSATTTATFTFNAEQTVNNP